MKKYFYLSMLMLVLAGCSSSDSDSIFTDPVLPGDQIRVTDMVGTIRFDEKLDRWYIYFFHPGSIDAEDALFPVKLDKKYQQDNLRVIVSGTTWKINVERDYQLGGWEDYAIKIDHIEEYTSEISKNNSSVSGCKKTLNYGTRTDSEDYFEYQAMDGGYLYFKHINAMFNCEPEELYMLAEIVGNDIHVVEIENNPGANCICPYDLGCKIGPLTEGEEYTLHLHKGYDNLSFKFIYDKSMSGTWTHN